MDMRKLGFGLGAILLVLGLLLACFAPGGFFNSATTDIVSTPLGKISVTQEKKASVWTTVGYVMLGVGTITLVLAYAMGPKRK
jgi:hypothetical protein